MKIKKTLQELNLLDRFLFAEATEDKEFLETLLEIILEKDIVLKHLPQTEKEFRNALKTKNIRVDVWDEAMDGDVYDVEAQNENTGNLPKRSRYYQGLIDIKLLPEGTVDYNRLNDIYIILIAPFDLFGKGRYRHTFRMVCVEENDVDLGDGATRIFLNTRGKDRENISEELAALLRYLETSTDEMAKASGSERIKSLHRKVEAIKANKEVGVKYMNEYEEKMLAKQEGFEDGMKIVAVRMLKENIDKSCIARMTELSMEEIEGLEAGLLES